MSPIEQTPLIARIADMERHVGQGKWDDAAAFFTEDAFYRVAGRGSYRGVEGIRQYMGWQRGLVAWVGHDPDMMVEHDGIVIIEVISLFKRLSDGADLAIPCTDIYRFDGERICDWRVYADTTDFFESQAPRHPAPNEGSR